MIGIHFFRHNRGPVNGLSNRVRGASFSSRTPSNFRPGKACLLLLVLLTLGLPSHGAPPDPPFSVALLSFTDQRRSAGEDWLGRYLRESLTRILARVPQVAIHDPDTAPLWRARLGLRDIEKPSLEALKSLGAGVVVLGTTQQVLTLAEIRLRAVGADGDLLPNGVATWKVRLDQDSPGSVVTAMAETLGRALVPNVPLPQSKSSEDWAHVRELYGLVQHPLDSEDPAARPRRVVRMEPFLSEPQLGTRAHEALARLHLEQAMLHMPEGEPRNEGLRRALNHATAAFKADPRDTWVQALKGEIHFFLREDYQARTDASVARIRNPLNALAYVVLGLGAGLSTGESVEQFNRAFRANPFLRGEDRPSGSPPYQGGLLEPSFSNWARLQAEHTRAVRPDYTAVLSKAVALFELENWEEAENQFREAAQLEQDDFVPWLYLNRILIETGRSGLAVQPLTKLAQEYPHDSGIRFHLGIALEMSGESAEALQVFKKLREEKPGDVEVLYHLAGAELFEGRWPRAKATLESLLQLDRNHREGWMRMARVSEFLKEPEQADRAYREVLRINPGDKEAQRKLLDLKESAQTKK